MGHDFLLTGYRIFVRYTTSEGKSLRGLYILRSDTDKKKMAFLGNVFTHYNYSTTDIDFSNSRSIITVQSDKSDLDIKVNLENEDAVLPPSSPFHNWKEARRFAGPLPFTFTYNTATKKVLIIEGVRENWIPRPVEVMHSNVLQNIPYYWKKGKIDLWKG
jgi:hypothetical protein